MQKIQTTKIHQNVPVTTQQVPVVPQQPPETSNQLCQQLKQKIQKAGDSIYVCFAGTLKTGKTHLFQSVFNQIIGDNTSKCFLNKMKKSMIVIKLQILHRQSDVRHYEITTNQPDFQLVNRDYSTVAFTQDLRAIFDNEQNYPDNNNIVIKIEFVLPCLPGDKTKYKLIDLPGLACNSPTQQARKEIFNQYCLNEYCLVLSIEFLDTAEGLYTALGQLQNQNYPKEKKMRIHSGSCNQINTDYLVMQLARQAPVQESLYSPHFVNIHPNNVDGTNPLLNDDRLEIENYFQLSLAESVSYANFIQQHPNFLNANCGSISLVARLKRFFDDSQTEQQQYFTGLIAQLTQTNATAFG